MNGLMTEREWRRQAARAKPPQPVCWGAQCVLPAQKRKKLRDDRSFSVFLLLLSLSAALAIPMLTPRTVRQEYPQATAAQSTEGVQARGIQPFRDGAHVSLLLGGQVGHVIDAFEGR